MRICDFTKTPPTKFRNFPYKLIAFVLAKQLKQQNALYGSYKEHAKDRYVAQISNLTYTLDAYAKIKQLAKINFELGLSICNNVDRLL